MSVRLERMIVMDATIRSSKYPSINFFIQRFEVSERTIRSDLAFLRDRLEAPLQFSRIYGGYYYSDPTWSLPAILVDEGELIAFFLSVELTRRYLGTVFETPLRKAIDRIAQNLPNELSIDLDQLTQHYTFQSGATAKADPQILSVLFKALRERHPIEMLYFTASSGERKWRVIEPYHLYNVRGDWQIVAFDHHRQQFRQFAVSRIEQWKVLSHQQFQRDPDFSAQQYLSTGFLAERGDTAVAITIWFDSYQASYIRGREWHTTQQVEEGTDGSLTLSFCSGALDEVKRWVMSYGHHARVLEPDSLAADIRQECLLMLGYPESSSK